MNLGEILSAQDNGKALVGRPVEFQIVKKRVRYTVKALFFPVSEAERQQSKRDAVKYLRSLPDYQKTEEGILPPIPDDVREEERQYRFLATALHNPENEDAKFIRNSDYSDFRAGVVVDQINWLGRQYDKYIQDEYPEILTDSDCKDLEDEAAGK